MDKISAYRGKPIEQMTREELIDALNFLASQLTAEREEHARQLDVFTGRTTEQGDGDELEEILAQLDPTVANYIRETKQD